MNRVVQPQKMVRGLKFGIQEVEGLYHLCIKNKDADQLHGYRAADLHGYRVADLCLCFCICK